MPPIPGVVVTPTTMLNALLGSLPEDGVPVLGPDRVAAVLPMYEEVAGASAALASVLEQQHPLDEVVVSVNGGRDATPQVVAATLRAYGYRRGRALPPPVPGGTAQRWEGRAGRPAVIVLGYPQPTGKAASINEAVVRGYVSAERVLVMDGDTILAPDFVARLREHFYRLRVERDGDRRRYVIEDVALQSGAVMSRQPRSEGFAAGLISRARTAEYAFAVVLRRGQTRRVGGGSVFGASRLYTVVGCGFTARRDTFPMAAETLTEDHDHTLDVQNRRATDRTIDVDTLDQRGFRVLVGTNAVLPSAALDRHDAIVLRRGGEARFVSGARMETEDPPHLGGYVRQVERWFSGGLENTLKRTFVPDAWRSLRPNVRFAFAAMQLEAVLWLSFLLVLVPIALGLHAALPGFGLGMPVIGFGAWLAFDLVFTTLFCGLGFLQFERARGVRGVRLARRVGASVRYSVLAFLALKYLNPLLYVAAATRVVPAFVRARREERATTVTWERPAARAARLAPGRTASVAAIVLAQGLGLFFSGAYLASAALPEYREAYVLTQRGARFDPERYLALPLVTPGSGPVEVSFRTASRQGPRTGWLSSAPISLDDLVAELSDRDQAWRDAGWVGSRYCRVGPAAANTPRRVLDGDAASYVPLGPWGRMMLARAVPIVPYIEQAASVYDLDAGLLLQMLINESGLDPLAIGPTDDVGLSQITDDALALLSSISEDPASPFANPHLLRHAFNLFDPDFSVCAGAAKLAWAVAQPGGDDDRVAYARYINPLTGVVQGRVSDRHAPLVDAFDAVRPLVDAIANAIAAYRIDPESVAAPERALLRLAEDAADGDLAVAYQRTAQLVADLKIEDLHLYRTVLEELYDVRWEAEALPASPPPSVEDPT